MPNKKAFNGKIIFWVVFLVNNIAYFVKKSNVNNIEKSKSIIEFHPSKIIPYTPKEEIVKLKIKPVLISESIPLSEKGITPQDIRLRAKLKTGASKNINLFALLGIITSLSNNLNPSAKGCNKPKTPTALGPFLRCIIAKTFLSKRVKYATDTKIKITMIII
jgi:hypothetical protein